MAVQMLKMNKVRNIQSNKYQKLSQDSAHIKDGKLCNNSQPLTVVPNLFILDVYGGPGYAPEYQFKFNKKYVCIRSYSGLHFPVFGLNTERHSVSLRIQSKCGTMWTRITPNMGTFYPEINSIEFVLVSSLLTLNSCFLIWKQILG